MQGETVKSRHGCAVVLERAGVLILGESGSGKSELAARLIRRWHDANCFARWVADDRIYLQSCGGRVVARVPKPIAGLAECRFAGVLSVDHLPAAIVDLAISLHPYDELERLPDSGHLYLPEIDTTIPLIRVPRGDPARAEELVEAHFAA